VARLDSDGSRYRTIQSPTLVLAGEKSLPAFLPPLCEELAAIIPTAGYELIADLGHQRPDNYAPAVIAERIASASTTQLSRRRRAGQLPGRVGRVDGRADRGKAGRWSARTDAARP
jgi:hypothetical protein